MYISNEGRHQVDDITAAGLKRQRDARNDVEDVTTGRPREFTKDAYGSAMRNMVTPLSQIPLLQDVRDGLVSRRFVVSESFVPLAQQVPTANADGVIWAPHRGVSSIIRTALAKAATVSVIWPIPIVNTFAAASFITTFGTARDFMIPAKRVPLQPEPTGLYSLCHVTGGCLNIQSAGTSGSTAGTQVQAGIVAAAQVADTRGLYDFDRAKMCVRATNAKNCSTGEQVVAGVTAIIQNPAAYSLTSAPSNTTSGHGTHIFHSSITSADPQDAYLVSHFMSALPSTVISTPDIPWGATPNFVITIPSNSGVLGAQNVLIRTYHLYVKWGSTGVELVTTSAATSPCYSMTWGNGITGTAHIVPIDPLDSTCVWAGTLFVCDRMQAPMGTPAMLPTVDMFLPNQQERAWSDVWLMRVDDTNQQPLSTSVSGTIFANVLPIGEATALQQAASMDQRGDTISDQETMTRNALDPTDVASAAVVSTRSIRRVP